MSMSRFSNIIAAAQSAAMLISLLTTDLLIDFSDNMPVIRVIQYLHGIENALHSLTPSQTGQEDPSLS